MKLKCGLLGEKLSHSYSPRIHAELGDYEYLLCEKAPEEVGDFIRHGDYAGMNVTIPYKKTVLGLMDELSPTARATGSVNTVIRRKDQSLFGDNTDVYGFTRLVEKSGANLKDKKVLVLGSGGSSLSVVHALNQMGARPVVISRSGENNYTNLSLHADARAVVNTTPLGMYPENGRQALSLTLFPHLEAVLDLIYNPARTALLLEADELGIPAENGLYMLVMQAKKSSELFTGVKIDDAKAEKVYSTLESEMKNIALIGMPGCGKSSVAEKLALLTNREILDCDGEVEHRSGLSAEKFILGRGETEFRKLETEILRDFSKRSGCILSTGGGCVTVEENYRLLKQNSFTVWLKRDPALLPTDGRPISRAEGVKALYAKRAPLYRRFADAEIEVGESTEETARAVLKAIERKIDS